MAFDFTSQLDEINRRRRALPAYTAQGAPMAQPDSWWGGQGGGGAQTAGAPVGQALGLGADDLRGSVQGLLPAGWERFQGALGQSMDLAGSLAAEENANRQQGIATARGSFERLRQANRPMTEEEKALKMGKASDAATGQSLDRWSALRSQLGEMGYTGGGRPAYDAAQIELGRLGQIQGSKRDLAIAEAERQSQNASNEFMAAMGLGNFEAQGPSMLGLDQFNSLLDFGANVTLGEKEIDASKYAAKQSAKAGKQSMFGSIFGGLLGAL